MGLDAWKAPFPDAIKNVEERVTLVQGLDNGPHTIEIIPKGDDNVPVKALVVHRPPLSEQAHGVR